MGFHKKRRAADVLLPVPTEKHEYKMRRFAGILSIIGLVGIIAVIVKLIAK
jgi:hypothetical protein